MYRLHNMRWIVVAGSILLLVAVDKAKVGSKQTPSVRTNAMANSALSDQQVVCDRSHVGCAEAIPVTVAPMRLKPAPRICGRPLRKLRSGLNEMQLAQYVQDSNDFPIDTSALPASESPASENANDWSGFEAQEAAVEKPKSAFEFNGDTDRPKIVGFDIPVTEVSRSEPQNGWQSNPYLNQSHDSADAVEFSQQNKATETDEQRDGDRPTAAPIQDIAEVDGVHIKSAPTSAAPVFQFAEEETFDDARAREFSQQLLTEAPQLTDAPQPNEATNEESDWPAVTEFKRPSEAGPAVQEAQAAKVTPSVPFNELRAPIDLEGPGDSDEHGRQNETGPRVAKNVLNGSEVRAATSMGRAANIRKATEYRPKQTPPSVLDHAPSVAAQDFSTIEAESNFNDWKQSLEPVPNAPRQAPVSARAMYGLPTAIQQRVVHHIEYGKSLARRGASFAAKQELYSGLRLVAQSLDSQSGSHHHTQSLKNALTALNEASSFYVTDSEYQLSLNVAREIETHRSQVLTGEEAEYMTAIEALQRYYSHAQRQFAEASGHSVVAGEALFTLGKIYSVMANQATSGNPLGYAKAIVHHRAALSADANHYRAAHELGTLLARNGQLEESCELLKHSARILPTAQTWRNLAIVHERLGENELAQLAHGEYHLALDQVSRGPRSIHWLPVEQFNATGPQEMEFHRSVAKLPATTEPEAKENKKGNTLFDKLKELF